MSVSQPRVCARQCFLALGVRILFTVKVFNLRFCLLHPSLNGNCISSLCSGSTLFPLPLPSWVLGGSETCAHEPKKSEQGGSAAGISVSGFSGWGSRTTVPAVPFCPNPSIWSSVPEGNPRRTLCPFRFLFLEYAFNFSPWRYL